MYNQIREQAWDWAVIESDSSEMVFVNPQLTMAVALSVSDQKIEIMTRPRSPPASTWPGGSEGGPHARDHRGEASGLGGDLHQVSLQRYNTHLQKSKSYSTLRFQPRGRQRGWEKSGQVGDSGRDFERHYYYIHNSHGTHQTRCKLDRGSIGSNPKY